MEVKISRTVDVELRRVEWKHSKCVDFFVQVNKKLLGMVSEYDYRCDQPAFWKVTTETPGMERWDDRRKFVDKGAAVAALVRFAAKHGVI